MIDKPHLIPYNNCTTTTTTTTSTFTTTTDLRNTQDERPVLLPPRRRLDAALLLPLQIPNRHALVTYNTTASLPQKIPFNQVQDTEQTDTHILIALLSPDILQTSRHSQHIADASMVCLRRTICLSGFHWHLFAMHYSVSWSAGQDYRRNPSDAVFAFAHHETVLPTLSAHCRLARLFFRLPVSRPSSSLLRQPHWVHF